MNDTYIVTTYVVIDDVLKAYGFVDDSRATGTAAEILTVSVIAAKYFQNHHERALCVMSRRGYVQALSVSRFPQRPLKKSESVAVLPGARFLAAALRLGLPSDPHAACALRAAPIGWRLTRTAVQTAWSVDLRFPR